MKTGFRLRLWFFYLLLSLAILHLAINFYGLSQSLRKPGLGVTDKDKLRFVPEEVWSYEESLKRVDDLSKIDSATRLAEQANEIVNNSLIHVRWHQVDPTEYRQIIPIWENPYLYILGRFSSMPQINQYHFADKNRTIERGIGICGDAATTLSSILDSHDIANRIVSFRGHVVVEYQQNQGPRRLLDPDFGVVIAYPLASLGDNLDSVYNKYRKAGYGDKETKNLIEIYQSDYAIFDDTKDFMTKRYWFEYFSYWMKWVFPIFIFIIGFLGIMREHSTQR